jgi:hypothetical protein
MLLTPKSPQPLWGFCHHSEPCCANDLIPHVREPRVLTNQACPREDKMTDELGGRSELREKVTCVPEVSKGQH